MSEQDKMSLSAQMPENEETFESEQRPECEYYKGLSNTLCSNCKSN